MHITDIIRSRKSCRNYRTEKLSNKELFAITQFLNENSKGLWNEEIRLQLIDKGRESTKMKLNYGLIRGNQTYILGQIKSTTASRVNYGYQMQKAVLKATELNLGTCWIGYFDEAYFPEIKPNEGFEIPGIIIIGYSAESTPFSEKIIRSLVKASQRLNWDKLFFDFTTFHPLKPDLSDSYYAPLEMVRLAPSSGNTQPWRIYRDPDSGEFHFFKKPVNSRYESKGLHDIDLGIAMAHFELTALSNGLTGNWIKHTHAQNIAVAGLHYIASWKY